LATIPYLFPVKGFYFTEGKFKQIKITQAIRGPLVTCRPILLLNNLQWLLSIKTTSKTSALKWWY